MGGKEKYRSGTILNKLHSNLSSTDTVVSTVSVLFVPSLQNSRGIVTWEPESSTGWKGRRAGASCAGGSAGLSLASRKHSDLRELLLRSPKRGVSLRTELRECAA